MSFFGLHRTSDRYGVIIDVGSGSVLAAIVHSSPSQKHPRIVWSHREPAPLRNIDSLERSTKAVMTALVTVLMQLDAEGRKVLYEYDRGANITEMQTAISAPWSYTVTKSINYQQEEPFVVTDNLVTDLIVTIQENAETELEKHETLRNIGLVPVVHAMLGLTANGYRVKHPEGEEVKELAISHTSAVAQEYLVDAINEMHEKLFPRTESRKLSFILVLYTISRDLLPQAYDVCLVDITYEATEIGIVRDGILTYSTHTPFGSFSLAREISAVTNVPLHEAIAYLHTEKPYAFMESLNKNQREDIDAMFEAYIDRVSSLFYETGDSLSIPRQISLHTDSNTETIFTDLIEKAAKRSTRVNPKITLISNEVIKRSLKKSEKNSDQSAPTDVALLISAEFFHNRHAHTTFQYL